MFSILPIIVGAANSTFDYFDAQCMKQYKLDFKKKLLFHSYRIINRECPALFQALNNTILTSR